MKEKQALIDHCQALLDEKIKSNEIALDGVKSSIQNETKSSAGDKFETARATLQREIDRLKGSIIKLKQQVHLLKQTPLIDCNTVSPGALVKSGSGTYFISIGLGKIKIEDQNYYAISPQAPIYLAMRDKKEKETFTFNGKLIKIVRVQ